MKKLTLTIFILVFSIFVLNSKNKDTNDKLKTEDTTLQPKSKSIDEILKNVDEKKGFKNSQDALGFILTAIEKNDYDFFKKKIIVSENFILETQKKRFEELKKLNKKTSLIQLYKDFKFPDSTKSRFFKFGGCDLKYNYLHIIFYEKGGKWFLYAILKCI